MIGELLKGHAGQYRLYAYPKDVLSSEDMAFCLQDTLPGDPARGNQTFRYLTCGGQLLQVSAYSELQTDNDAGTVYQHAILSEPYPPSPQAQAVTDTVFVNFAGESDFQNVVNQRIAFAPHWGRTGLSPRPLSLSLRLNPELRADLACNCLYRGITHDFGSLVILVPPSYDYLSYCRAVMASILLCIPRGLWHYLSFATNPDESGKKHFVVLFAPEGARVSAQRHMVCSLTEAKSLPLPALCPETISLIRTAALSADILTAVEAEVERSGAAGPLTEKSYIGFWQRYSLRQQPMDTQLLQTYCCRLMDPNTEEEQQLLEADVLNRLSAPDALEAVLSADPDLMSANTPEQLDAALDRYTAVFRLLNRELSPVFSLKLLTQILPSSLRELEQLTEAENRLQACRSAGETGVLSTEAVQNCHADLWQKTQEANRRRAADFEKSLPANWNPKKLRSLLDTLAPCQETVRSQCRKDLVEKATQYLECTSLSEHKVQQFYTEMSDLLGKEPEFQPLENWYETWQAEKEQRQNILDSIHGYQSYLEIQNPGEEGLRYLLRWFENNGYKHAGIRDLLQAAESVWGKSWPRLLNRLESLLRALQKRNLFGIWLEPGKNWADLYSELLAGQMIQEMIGQIDLHLWYAGSPPSAPAYPLSDVLATVSLVKSVAIDGEEALSPLYSNRALTMILRAGMLSAKEKQRLRDVLQPDDLSLLDQQKNHFHRKHASASNSRWKFSSCSNWIEPFRRKPLLSLLAILVSLILIAVIVVIIVVTLSPTPQEPSAPSEASPAPISENLDTTPSPTPVPADSGSDPVSDGSSSSLPATEMEPDTAESDATYSPVPYFSPLPDYMPERTWQ